jgi:hypothetical protein
MVMDVPYKVLFFFADTEMYPMIPNNNHIRYLTEIHLDIRLFNELIIRFMSFCNKSGCNHCYI